MKLNTIYCMDCMKFLDKIPCGKVDLAVIDPPYNMKKADWDTFTDEEFKSFTKIYLKKIIAKLKETGSLYIFNTPLNSIFIADFLIREGMQFCNWIVWNKKDGISSSKTKYKNAQEVILFFTKSKEYVFNYDEIRVPYDNPGRVESGVVKGNKRWFPNPKGALCSDVWLFSSERHTNKVKGKIRKTKHITPKPLPMIERIIKASSNEGNIVLDCFSGSGTTAVASKLLGRRFICCDSNKEYVDLSIDRLRNTQLKLM